MAFGNENIKRISELAALFIEEQELEGYAQELESILGDMNELKELDTDDSKPMEHVLPLSNVFRKDTVTNSDNRDELMKNVSAVENGCYIVPMTVDAL